MRRLRITIGNRSYDVTVEDLTERDPYQPVSAPHHVAPPPGPAPTAPTSAQAAPHPPAAAGAVTSPMAGVIKSVLVKPSDQVKQGEPLVVLEAMKMENHIAAHVAGTVKTIHVKDGDSVREGHVLLELE
ncbi:MAG: acetyl-CoA carboxylase biotin carboxyl carrier protein subunit [Planctomycetota bacterium]|nr:MAG: acetyl-CoA carboxylase biotin carboxyl carrier protein subunit [Planctomycetota bacterium]REK22444.1 MAG: acetyl-CoA carboxylase biotin carboxyl carrier protein subunit [Planctomycetota bacterium]REK34906.1 MAG: acetyl-CoA carboxylase biotin carboxyl carrier protein subunit [Planctomycetota bacterium]